MNRSAQRSPQFQHAPFIRLPENEDEADKIVRLQIERGSKPSKGDDNV